MFREVLTWYRVPDSSVLRIEVTVQRSDGQEITYNPAQLSGVNVYRESNRIFSEGDRIQFRAPFSVFNQDAGS
jgi:hypothetical protein